MVSHPFVPVYDCSSRVLILGSFPSVRSREAGFYYGHPKNRFWPLMSRLLGADLPAGAGGRERLLLDSGIALWDVVNCCEIAGSSDSSIACLSANPVALLTEGSRIGRVLLNGRVAADLYRRMVRPLPDLPYCVLPSTSSANAAWGMERLAQAWGEAMAGALR